MKNPLSKRKIYFLMVLAVVFWAGAFIAGKISVREFPPCTLTFFRFVFATLVIFPVMLIYEKDNWKLKLRDLPMVILLGMLGMFLYHYLFFTALKYTTAVNSAVVGGVGPLLTSILASLWVGEKLGVKRFGAILLAFSGVVLATTGGRLDVLTSLSFNIGDLLMIAAVTSSALYSVLSKKVADRYPPLVLVTYVFLVCLVALVPFVIAEKPLDFLPRVSWQGWAAVLYMAVFASSFGYLIHQMSIRSIGASRTMVFVYLVPVFTMILSAFILREKITVVSVISAGIIISGVYLNSIISSTVAPVKRDGVQPASDEVEPGKGIVASRL